MELYHRTPHGPAILEHGFAICHTRDQGADIAFLAGSREGTCSGKRGDWLIVVDVPDDVAEAHAVRFNGLLSHYQFSFADINAYPRRLERWLAAD